MSFLLAIPLLAQAAPDTGTSPFGGSNSMFFLIAIFFAIFYFMIIRPQQKQQKSQQTFIDGLKKGDEVVTTGGIIGRIAAVSDAVLTLEIANNVKIRVLKNQVTTAYQEKPAAEKAAADAGTQDAKDAKK